VRNTGPTDAIFDIIADHHAADSTYYPESDKWQLKPQRKIFRMVEVDYFDGEEGRHPASSRPAASRDPKTWSPR
jgi:hypothetical protein